MLKAVFISDLHLEPQRPDILSRFDAFLAWFAASSAEDLYILGDFFHVWFGDDLLEPLAYDIAAKLSTLAAKGKRLWFIPGNRDFLLGSGYAAQASMRILSDPTLIFLNDTPVLLAHGDAYCTQDKKHMRFRKLSRHPWVQALYWRMPKVWRLSMVRRIRAQSQLSRKPFENRSVYATQAPTMLADMRRHNCTVLIHGHTHKPGKKNLAEVGGERWVWVLSDWDDTPKILCYDDTEGLYYKQFPEAS